MILVCLLCVCVFQLSQLKLELAHSNPSINFGAQVSTSDSVDSEN